MVEKPKMILYVDMDGVLVDFMSGWRRWPPMSGRSSKTLRHLPGCGRSQDPYPALSPGCGVIA